MGHDLNGSMSGRPLRTLTRKGIKPTRLFETEEQKEARERAKEEEAETEIEDNGAEAETNKPDTAYNSDLPTSKHIHPKKTQRGSPFDSWARIKPGSKTPATSAVKQGKKRAAADALDTTPPSTSKRTRAS